MSRSRVKRLKLPEVGEVGVLLVAIPAESRISLQISSNRQLICSMSLTARESTNRGIPKYLCKDSISGQP
jgi:hypothetical protein